MRGGRKKGKRRKCGLGWTPSLSRPLFEVHECSRSYDSFAFYTTRGKRTRHLGPVFPFLRLNRSLNVPAQNMEQDKKIRSCLSI